jgi:uncharacterized protein (DUF342 family)
MSQSLQHTEPQVSLEQDNMRAVLFIPPATPKADLSAPVCMALFQEKGVLFSSDLVKALQTQIDAYQPDPTEETQFTLEGTPRQDGEDGRLEWSETIKESIDIAEKVKERSRAGADAPSPPPRPADGDEETSAEDTDFYNQSRFVVVHTDDHIATLYAPVDGVDGADITGKVMNAKIGAPLKITTDENIIIDSEGRLIAQINGVLDIAGKTIRVLDNLRVDSDVDFNSGNVNAGCDVEILKGVRDCFAVKTPGHVTVHGIIEAATIHAGGTLRAHGGMAAKMKGRIEVGLDCHAKYLSNVQGSIKGDLVTDREIVNCTLSVGGGVPSERASLIGSKLYATGAIHIVQLGSEAYEKVWVGLGSAPAIEQALRDTTEAIKKLEEELAGYTEKLEALRNAKAGKTASQKEDLTEFMCLEMMHQTSIQGLTKKHDPLDEYYQYIRQVELMVEKHIYPGAIIIVDGTEYHIQQAIKGPCWVGYDSKQRLIVRDCVTKDEAPLGKFAKIELAKPDGV